ncbi:MAG: SbcC/MukB-like Walker B domain-containing protein, partial [Bacteroidota bacterium]
QKKWQQATDMIAQHIATFQEHSGQTYVRDTAQQDLDKMDTHQKYLDSFLDTLNALALQDKALQTVTEKGKQVKAKLNKLTAQETSATEHLENAQQDHAYKQEIHRQQQLILSYEERRAALKLGEACPLCFSTEQPFRTQHWKADFVNQAAKELQIAEQHLTQQEKAMQNIRNLLSEAKGEYKQLQDTWQVENKKMLTLQSQAQQQHPQKKIIDLGELAASILTQTNAKKAHETQRDRLKEILSYLQIQEHKEQQIEHESKLLQNTISGLEQQYSLQQEQLQENVAERTELLAASSVLLEKYDCQATFSLLRKQQQTLAQYWESYSNQQKLTTTQQTTLKDLQQQVGYFEAQLRETQEHKRVLTQQYQTIEATLTALQQQRLDAFGKTPLEQAIGNWKTNFQAVQQQAQALRTQQHQLQSDIAVVKTSRKEKQQQLLNTQQQGEQQQQQLLEAIQQVGFTDLKSLQNAFLPTPEFEKLAHQKNQLEHTQNQLEHSLQEVEQYLTSNPAPPIDQVALNQESQQQEDHYSELQQRIGALREQLQQDAQRKQQAQDLMKRIAQQRQSRDRWYILKELIGSSDGKKFRAFAQGLTLQQLVYLANRHLEKLNNRYRIQKQVGDKLALEIIDHYQANNVRPASTLSGGESFLVSLALALGLSDLAGKNTQIRSLFIDEGFGTLDENTLDMAITTLENLQASGKTIGVISHVKALQERISTQIQVQKKGNGFSTVQVIVQ